MGPRELTGFNDNGRYVGYAIKKGSTWRVWRNSLMRGQFSKGKPIKLKTQESVCGLLASWGAVEIEDSASGQVLPAPLPLALVG